jgi:hypothetical protein
MPNKLSKECRLFVLNGEHAIRSEEPLSFAQTPCAEPSSIRPACTERDIAISKDIMSIQYLQNVPVEVVENP